MIERDALSVTREGYDAAASTYAQLFRDTLRDSPEDFKSSETVVTL